MTKQVSLETKLKIINYKDPNKYDQFLENKVIEHNQLLFNSNLGILTDPNNYISAAIEIEKNNLNFVDLTSNSKFNFVEIFSNDLFHLKLNNCYILTTKKFSYFNFDTDIHIQIANGTLRLYHNNLILTNSTKNIDISYFLAKFSDDQYLNVNWSNNYA